MSKEHSLEAAQDVTQERKQGLSWHVLQTNLLVMSSNEKGPEELLNKEAGEKIIAVVKQAKISENQKQSSSSLRDNFKRL